MEGYEDIDKLTKNQSAMLDNALNQQNDIVNQQTQMNIADIERNKQKLDEDVTKTNKALYKEYQKQVNPYGANAERLASQGLLNSGYAETTRTNLFNTYQQNVTDTLNTARTLKADFDNEILKATQTGNIAKAQNALELYKQKMQLLTQEYELKNDREKYLYQKSQDALTQANWQKEYERQLQRDAEQNRQYREQFDYQRQRDEIADSQWERQYELSKKASASSSSSRSGSSSRSSSGSSSSEVSINPNNTANTDVTYKVANSVTPINSTPSLVTGVSTMYVQALLQGTEPNSEARKNGLQNLINGGVLSQSEANKLLGA
jgi:hypothetical protein